jgi:hypothetical protein
VSGGDDQAVTLTWLTAAWETGGGGGGSGGGGGAPPTLALARTGAIALPSAHDSAVRGLWAGAWGGGLRVVSVCLEQRVRVWRVLEGGGGGGGAASAASFVEACEPARVQVQCPENLAGLVSEGGRRLVVAVVGRGVEALSVGLDD